MVQEIKIEAEPSNSDLLTCKFNVDRPIYAGGSAYFSNQGLGKGSPLAEKLFDLKDIAEILIAENSVTVTHANSSDWPELAKEVGAAIREHIKSGQPAVSENFENSLPDSEIIREGVQEVLDTIINPAVASHGGVVSLLDVQKNNVYLQFGGGCQGCGMVDVTLKYGVEKSIREKVSGVGGILDTTDHANGRNPYYSPSAK